MLAVARDALTLLRLDAAGRVDRSFGANGVVTIPSVGSVTTRDGKRIEMPLKTYRMNFRK